jgi:hypothetical protein
MLSALIAPHSRTAEIGRWGIRSASLCPSEHGVDTGCGPRYIAFGEFAIPSEVLSFPSDARPPHAKTSLGEASAQDTGRCPETSKDANG